jgi:hypothetical protein
MAGMDRYTAKAISGEFGESKKKSTPYVEVMFEVIDGERKGTRFPWQGYLTDATQERSVGSLKLCGCTFPGDDITNLTGLGTKDVEIQVEMTDFGPRVAWVNESGGASITDENKLGGAQKKALAARLKGTLLSLKGGAAAKPKTATGAADPFAVRPTNDAAQGEASNDSSEPLQATGTDDGGGVDYVSGDGTVTKVPF